MTRKVLIVSASFYPTPYVSSVRVTQWARWLPEHGWKPVVACKNYGYIASRNELDRKVHPEVDVKYLNSGAGLDSKNGIRITTKTKSLIGAPIGRYLLSPDAGIIFWSKAWDRIHNLIDEIQPHAIVTTGPPHSVHSIGLRIKANFPGTPWIADFRDVFRLNGRYRVPWPEQYRSMKSLEFEKEVYRVADGIVCAIPTHRRWIARKFPSASSKVELILNGVPGELCDTSNSPHQEPETEHCVKVVGVCGDQEALTLAKAVKKLCQRGRKLTLRFVGKIPNTHDQIESLLGEKASFSGFVAHDVALNEISSAGILVAALDSKRSRSFQLTSKIFEYSAVPRPILVINPTRPDRRLFYREAGVYMLNHPSQSAIEACFEEALSSNYRELQRRALRSQERWSRKRQVKILASTLDRLCSTTD